MYITKQVPSEHYEFDRYMTIQRWSSMWYQIKEILALGKQDVLEIGGGNGLFKAIAGALGVSVKIVDVDPELEPDYVASITNIPLQDKSVEVACAFQVLEHLPFESSLLGLTELGRVARHAVVVSLPDSKKLYPLRFTISPRRDFRFMIPRPRIRSKVHQFDGEHYWEINKKGYALPVIMSKFLECLPDYNLSKTYRVPDNPYHRFFIFERI